MPLTFSYVEEHTKERRQEGHGKPVVAEVLGAYIVTTHELNLQKVSHEVADTRSACQLSSSEAGGASRLAVGRRVCGISASDSTAEAQGYLPGRKSATLLYEKKTMQNGKEVGGSHVGESKSTLESKRPKPKDDLPRSQQPQNLGIRNGVRHYRSGAKRKMCGTT